MCPCPQATPETAAGAGGRGPAPRRGGGGGGGGGVTALLESISAATSCAASHRKGERMFFVFPIGPCLRAGYQKVGKQVSSGMRK